jgi:hypothetical protein
MQEDRNFASELKINKLNLDQEWEEQGERAIYWAKRAARAQKELDTINMKRKIMKARLYKKYRSELEATRDKTTDIMIESCIRADPEYQKLTEELIDAKETASILDSAKWEFVSRKVALEHLQEGITIGLFADPREINDRNIKAYESIREQIRERRGVK